MKNKPPLLVLILFLATFIWPIGLILFKTDFHFINLLTYLKEFSIPVWILLFSIAWLIFRYDIAKNKHFEKLAEASPPANNILKVAEREKRIEILKGLKKLNNANRSIKSMEIIIALGGILAGLVGVLSYWFS